MVTEKTCYRCKTTKPASDFYHKRKDGGPTGYCRPCAIAYAKSWYPAKKQKMRADSLNKLYGVSLAEFAKIAESQGGVCAICGKKPNKRHLDVDHCHTTGRVRGLLCSACNIGIGTFKDDPRLMLAAAKYLEGTNA